MRRLARSWRGGHRQAALVASPQLRARARARADRARRHRDRSRSGEAPITTANFLRYVDGGHYDGGTFHRTVKMDNQPESPVKIEVIQAGVNPDRAKDGFPAIALERTSVTGLRHKDGVVSMARGAARQRHVGLVHLHQRSAVARLRRRAQSGRSGLRGLRTRRARGWTWCGSAFSERPTPRPSG